MKGNLMPVPIMFIDAADHELYAMLSLQLLAKHPDTAAEFFTQHAGSPPPEDFLKNLALATEQVLATFKVYREKAKEQQAKSELEEAQAEVNAIPKDKLN